MLALFPCSAHTEGISQKCGTKPSIFHRLVLLRACQAGGVTVAASSRLTAPLQVHLTHFDSLSNTLRPVWRGTADFSKLFFFFQDI